MAARSDAWERAASNEDELLSTETDELWSLIQRAAEMEDTDAASAFRLYREAAEAGSVWSMRRTAWGYWTGTGVAADLHLSLLYYDRAICGGSWMASIQQARLLAEMGRYEDCERTLEGGIASGFVPAHFWLARFRYERSKAVKVCGEVRPLLEYAAQRGHPTAKLMLARWMMLGKLGVRNIPRGWRLVMQEALSFACRRENAVAS